MFEVKTFHVENVLKSTPPTNKSAKSKQPTGNTASTPLHIGYFARICPEKGAFRFLEAAAELLPTDPALRMSIGGFLPALHRKRFRQQLQTAARGCEDRLQWLGSPETREEKFRLLATFDWLCVPTEYREPKGLYVLEAALLGIPSLLPSHGAFPERIHLLQDGQLFEPSESLAAAIRRLPRSRTTQQRQNLAQRCLDTSGMQQAGKAVLRILTPTDS